MNERDSFRKAFIERDLREQRRYRNRRADLVAAGFLGLVVIVSLALIGASDLLIWGATAGTLAGLVVMVWRG